MQATLLVTLNLVCGNCLIVTGTRQLHMQTKYSARCQHIADIKHHQPVAFQLSNDLVQPCDQAPFGNPDKMHGVVDSGNCRKSPHPENHYLESSQTATQQAIEGTL
ncbi:hypothetical protein D3C81_1173790 [compost metagenome]